MNKIHLHEQEILEKFSREFLYRIPVDAELDAKKFMSAALNSQIEVVMEYIATYQLDLCENSERFRSDIISLLTPHEEEKK